MDHTSYLEVKRYQLELVMLGIALSNPGDRAKIINSMKGKEFIGERIGELLVAIENGNRNLIRGFFSARMQVKPEDTEPLIEAILRTLDQRMNESRARRAISQFAGACSAKDPGQVRTYLEDAIAILDATVITEEEAYRDVIDIDPELLT